MHRHLAVVILAFGLSACASLPDKRITRLDAGQVEFVSSARGLPTVIFENGLGGTMATSDLARFSNEKRVDIARLHPGSHQVWVDSGHAIPLDRPEAVVNAITAALAELRAAAPPAVR